MIADIKKIGLDSLILQKPENVPERNAEQTDHRYTKTIGFKVTEKQYETYRRYAKYFGIDDLIKKWRTDLDRIEQEKGRDMENVETVIRKRLNQ